MVSNGYNAKQLVSGGPVECEEMAFIGEVFSFYLRFLDQIYLVCSLTKMQQFYIWKTQPLANKVQNHDSYHRICMWNFVTVVIQDWATMYMHTHTHMIFQGQTNPNFASCQT